MPDLLKAAQPLPVTVFGIVISVRLLQSPNALPSIVSRFGGSVTPVSA